MAKIRTFIAVEATASIKTKAAMLVEHLAQTPANVKWVTEEQMHWTVKFLGEVENNEIPHICERIVSGVSCVGAFDILACGAGAFPNTDRPRTLWLGVQQGEEAFVCLHRHIEEALAELGFRRERRRFQPHLTIGRIRRGCEGVAPLAKALAGQVDFLAGRMQVRELVVFASRLRRSGPLYQQLCHIPLRS